MPNRTRIVLSLALLLAAALLALPATPAQSQGRSTTPTPAQSPEPRILYTTDVSGFGFHHDFFTMRADGSDKQPIAPSLQDRERWQLLVGASLSPDGNTLAFGGIDLTRPLSSDLREDMLIYLLDLNTNVSTRFDAGDYADRQPVWSPDGTLIAYLAWGENRELNVVDVGTGEVWTLLNSEIAIEVVGTNGFVYGFDWSPDGRRLAADMTLLRWENIGGYRTIFVMDADGSNVSQVTPAHKTMYSPAWSPQGNELYFTCDPTGSETFDVIEICHLDLGTSEIIQVTHLNASLDVRDITDIDVSRDNQLVFVLKLDGVQDIYRYDLATGELANLTADIDVGVYAPRWVESPPATP